MTDLDRDLGALRFCPTCNNEVEESEYVHAMKQESVPANGAR